MDNLVHDLRARIRNDWWSMGHFLAHVDRSRYLLDTSAHPHSIGGCTRGHRVRGHHSDGDLSWRIDVAQRNGKDLGISWPSWGIHRHLGMCGDAHLSTLRQLVA